MNNPLSTTFDMQQGPPFSDSFGGHQSLELYSQLPPSLGHQRPRQNEFQSFILIYHSCESNFPSATYTQTFSHQDKSELLKNLQKHYAFISSVDTVRDVLSKVPTLYSLLKEAVQPLRRVFGEKKFLHLETLETDEDTTLRVVVKLPSDTTNPAELMRKFKHDWWLANCARSQASLVFDYGIGNGF